MERLRRGQVVNFWLVNVWSSKCTLYILLHIHHGCFNLRYLRNSDKAWNSTIPQESTACKGWASPRLIWKSVWRLKCGSQALKLSWSFDYTPTRSPRFWGTLERRLLNPFNEVFVEERDLPSWASHNLLQILCSSLVKRAQRVVAGLAGQISAQGPRLNAFTPVQEIRCWH